MGKVDFGGVSREVCLAYVPDIQVGEYTIVHVGFALQKLDAYSKRLPLGATPSTAHLFIVQPLISGASFANLFSTHPPIAKRIERLLGRPSQTQQ